MKRRTILYFLFFSFLLAFVPENNYANQRAHTHGIAGITIAKEDNLLEIHLESPAVNIVGFEHRASTDEEVKILESAIAKLESPQGLFSFTGTACQVQEVSVDASSIANAEPGHEDHHNAHGEIIASYHFNCKQGSKLKTISMDLLSHFTGIETLHAMWVTENAQGSAELSVKSMTINLK